MSSVPNHKMYNYEVPPPEGVWENIAVELTEKGLFKNLSSRLIKIQAIPPAGIWENIAGKLNEGDFFNQIQAKLNSIEVIPPAVIWDKLTASMDTTPLINQLGEKLKYAEVIPPSNAWSKINTTLDTVTEAAVPEHRRFAPFLKYAVAASIVGLIAFGALQFFNKKNTTQPDVYVKESTTAPEKTNSITSPAKADPTPLPTPEAVAVTTDDARNDAALEASKKTYAKLDKPVSEKLNMATAFYFDNEMPSGTTRGLGDMFDIPEEQPIANNSNSRYIMWMTPDGNIIRMSKKLGDLVCCVSGENQDDECMHQLKQWKEKLANAYAGHSPGNFMDVFSLINSLQDNNP